MTTRQPEARAEVFVFPTSFAQQRLWFLDQLVPGNAFYNVNNAMRMAMRPSDVPVLERSLNEIFRRHESLRTTFKAVDGQPVQVVSPQLKVELPVVDLRRVPLPLRQAEALRRATEEAGQPFDLGTGPLVRTTLLRTAEAEYIFLLTMHHIVADGWSIGIFWSELTAIWQAFERGLPSPLPQLPIQYADFAVWQRGWLDEGAGEAHLEYWKQQLAGMPATQMPTDWPRPEAQSFVGASHTFWVSGALQTKLRRLSQSEGVTLFMTLLAAFQALLARYTGQDDIVVGAPIANRTRAEVEDLIGFFVNSLVLRSDLSGDPPFRVLLHRVREMALAAYEHQDLPFERLVQEIQPERDMSRHPLFQVSFQVFSADDSSQLAAFDDDQIDVEKGTANIDFALDLWEYADRLYARIEYSTDLFKPDSIERIANHFLTLLEGIVEQPDARVSELPVLTERERRQLLVEWNDTEATFDTQTCAHYLFEAQVAKTPLQTAVSSGGEELTYAELNARANQLAHHLIERGIGREDLVGLCVERSIDLVVALLAVWKSGAAYIPLDPAHPSERLAFMASDAMPSLVMTHQSTESRLASHPVRRCRLDGDRHLWDSAERSNPPHEAGFDNLAYVIYTSGSTGSPKGVMVTHRAVSNHLLWAQSALPLDPNDRVAQKYSIGFDASVLEIFGPLLAGARLVVTSPATYFDAREFVRLLDREQVTAIDVVPSMLRVLLDEAQFAGCRALRRVVCGGEALHVADQERFFSLMDAELHNAYGPTEATIGATLWTCRPGTAGSAVPIGRPIANTAIYLLDSCMNPVPVGVVGELWIGGASLARGYLNRPDLTRERFVPDPFSGRPDSRLYRSGDRARYLADGTIEYVGRVDDQIKLRGIRVEPGEVEACLVRHQSVAACAVVAYEPEPNAPQLVAYVVPSTTTPGLWPSIGEYSAYDELMYFAMAHDERRNLAYKAALEQFVAGKTVVDVGTGSEALLARMCAEAGAIRVYAIEVLDEAYSRARDHVRQLQLEDTITVIHGDSTRIELPEPVDACVSELLGTIGSSEGAAAILNDARRFLKPGGVMIPARCITHIAAVTLPDECAASPQFAEPARAYVDRIFEQAGRPFDLRVCVKDFPKENVISDVGVFETLDFRRPMPLESRTVVQLAVRARARVDGFLLWLTVHPSDDQAIDVLDGDLNWLPVFFPVFSPGFDVQPGDTIVADCWSALTHSVHPDYGVRGAVRRSDGTDVAFDYRSPYQNAIFKGNPFYEALFEGAANRGAGRAISTEGVDQLNRWREVYEELYRGSRLTPDPMFNPIGWNSSYTGDPIHGDHMHEQVAATVERIGRLRPQRVLDIGCGVGLILFPLAHRCSRYVGTDFSRVALDYVRSQLPSVPLAHVEVLERTADDFAGFLDNAYDVVVLNSVVQYFPSVEYLIRIIEEAVRVTAPGGHIFLGDVRSLPLLEAFYTSVELSQCPPSGRPVSELRERIVRRRSEEEELVIAPEFFQALRRAVPQISRVEVQLKRGWHRNELTQFRYDVTLEVKGMPGSSPQPLWRDWQEISSLEAMIAWASSTAAPVLGVRGIPNARLQQELQALEYLSQDGWQTFGGTDSPALEGVTGVEPEELWAMAGQVAADVAVTPSGSGSRGLMDVIISKNAREQAGAIADWAIPETAASSAWNAYATDPLQGKRARTLVPALNRYLKSILPEQMVPSTIVLLNALPRTAKGKVDKNALPLPTRLRAASDDSFVGARNEVEQRLAAIWSEVLRYRQVGVHDNFFTHLGGHSLLATQLISRVRDAFDIELPLRRLFEAPTIAELAVVVEDALIDIIEGLSDDSVKRLVEESGGYAAEN